MAIKGFVVDKGSTAGQNCADDRHAFLVIFLGELKKEIGE